MKFLPIPDYFSLWPIFQIILSGSEAFCQTYYKFPFTASDQVNGRENKTNILSQMIQWI